MDGSKEIMHAMYGEVKCPYLVVAGEDDELSPIECTYQLFDQIRTPKKLVVYQGERYFELRQAGQLHRGGKP